MKDKYKEILGENLYNDLLKFYQKIWNNKSKYKVFLSSKSYTLHNILNETKNDYNMMTDNALLLHSSELVEYYLNNNRFPEILLCDLFFIHGRTISDFLLQLEDRLIYEIQKRNSLIEAIEIRTKITYAIEIQIYLKNDHESMLMSRYAFCTKSERREKPCIWRNILDKINELIAKSNECNINYIFASYGIHDFENYNKTDVNMYITKYKDNKLSTYIKTININDEIHAVCSIHMKCLEEQDDFKIVIPFVFLPNLPLDNRNYIFFDILDKLNNKEWKDMLYKWIDNDFPYIRAINEFINCVIAHNYMYGILEMMPELYKVIRKKETEIKRITNNFGKEYIDIFDYIYNHRLYKIQELNDLLYKTTKTTIPFNKNTSFYSIEKIISYKENQIYQYALNAEKLSFQIHKTQRKIDLEILKNYKINLSNILNMDPVLDSIVIFHLLNYGAIELIECNYNNDMYSQQFKTDEQALFVEVLKMFEFLPLLFMIQNHYNLFHISESFYDYVNENFVQCINKKEKQIDEKILNKILEFSKDIEESGQLMTDWDFDMFDQYLVMSYGSSGEEISFSEKMKIIDHRHEWMRKYHE